MPGPVLSAFCASSHLHLTEQGRAVLPGSGKDTVTCPRSQLVAESQDVAQLAAANAASLDWSFSQRRPGPGNLLEMRALGSFPSLGSDLWGGPRGPPVCQQPSG